MGNAQCCDRQDPIEFTSQLPINNIKTTQIKKEVEQPKSNVSFEPKPQPQPQIHQQPTIKSEPENDQSIIPQLSPQIKKHLQNYKYFEEHFKFNPSTKSFGKQVYVGQLDKSTKIPEGYGKMYKSDGSLYIGEFHKGKAQGQGIYLMPNGSYYSGHFTHNCADGQGYYWSQELQYKGMFQKNHFQGQGAQRSKIHEFQGKYYEGFKVHGIYKWRDQQNNEYEYTGDFNAYGEFNGNGVLVESKGSYTGEFVNNLKFGKGVYKYTNGLRYEGDYKQGVKSGLGVLYNTDNTIAYEGEFKSDMPHGIGCVYHPVKGKSQTRWAYGIDSVFL